MKKIFCLALLMFGFAYTAQAQTTEAEIESEITKVKGQIDPLQAKLDGLSAQLAELKTIGWNYGGIGAINISNTQLSNNWAQGGESAFTIAANLNLFANYKKDKFLWENTGTFKMGFLKVKDTNLQKNDDELYLKTKAGYQLNEKLYVSAYVDFRSQFAKTFKYDDQGNGTLVSKFLAPAYLNAGPGIDYKPVDWVSIFFSPANYQATIVTADELPVTDRFGVPVGETMLNEFGAKLEIGATKVIIKDAVTATSNLMLFTNYLENPEWVTMNWNTVIGLKVTKYIAATVDFTLRYRKQEAEKLQFRNFVGVGLSAQF